MCLLISNVAIAHHTLRMSGMECGRCSSHAKVVVQSCGAKGGSTCVGGPIGFVRDVRRSLDKRQLIQNLRKNLWNTDVLNITIVVFFLDNAITHAHTYVIVVLCFPVTMHRNLRAF
jgi:hypothetical protein